MRLGGFLKSFFDMVQWLGVRIGLEVFEFLNLIELSVEGLVWGGVGCT